jgi:hypothetical protein
VFGEFFRILTPGGFLLLGFQVGEGPRHMANAYGHEVSLDAFLFTPEDITGLLAQGGFDVVAQIVRAPGEFERDGPGRAARPKGSVTCVKTGMMWRRCGEDVHVRTFNERGVLNSENSKETVCF